MFRRRTIGVAIGAVLGCATLFATASGQQLPAPSSQSLPVSPDGASRVDGAEARVDEMAVWRAARAADSVEMYKAYLAKFPDGVFVDLARAKIANAISKDSVPDAPDDPPRARPSRQSRTPSPAVEPKQRPASRAEVNRRSERAAGGGGSAPQRTCTGEGGVSFGCTRLFGGF